MKNIFTSKTGLSNRVMILAVVGLIILGAGAYLYAVNNGQDLTQDNSDTIMTSDKTAKDEGMMSADSMGEDSAEEMMTESNGMMEYAGKALAGASAKLLDFNKIDYDKAIASDKLVVLYFYANWCPICKEEFPKMQSAFDGIKTDKVVAFRVNYKDDQTGKDEEALAKEFGIVYQHTKVFIKEEQRVLKAPDSWDKDRYLVEISKFISLN